MAITRITTGENIFLNGEKSGIGDITSGPSESVAY
jgi:hypothetical protein